MLHVLAALLAVFGIHGRQFGLKNSSAPALDDDQASNEIRQQALGGVPQTSNTFLKPMRNDGDVLSADSIQDGSADVGRHAVEAHVEELKFSSWASPQWASPQKVAKASAPLISCTEEEHALGGPTLLPVAARGDPKDDVALLPKGQVRGGPVSTSTLHWLRA